jgi:ribosomal protein S18 acetylase RimI-like enzyme
VRKELPRIENNPKYRKFASGSERMLWRITCFVVHKKYRCRGVARTALKAALTAIQKQGGGLVEAYPIKRWGAYAEYRGTVSMFEKEGFQIVAPLGKKQCADAKNTVTFSRERDLVENRGRNWH